MNQVQHQIKDSHLLSQMLISKNPHVTGLKFYINNKIGGLDLVFLRRQLLLVQLEKLVTSKNSAFNQTKFL